MKEKNNIIWNMQPQANPNCIVEGNGYRITILTQRLFRFEYNSDCLFENQATQVVLNRNFETPDFTVEKNENGIIIRTDYLQVVYDEKPFSQSTLQVKLLGKVCNYGAVWNYGDKIYDLLGTARTLDGIDGACQLDSGLMARTGITVLDDSNSLILTEDLWVEPREIKEQDFYIFAYGHDYLQCLKDFYKLCGNQPMLPRYALGNWWSRYYCYDETMYRNLIERFKKEEIPFSVAVLDMDWHITDIDPKYGSGWTGYTWNKELFPNPESFLTWLHENGMRVTLNDHPADGIRASEECYKKVAEHMGIDPNSEKAVECDITDSKFVNTWFEHVLLPLEEQGVDFWWIDWQQGKKTKIDGLDPLWMQNHLRYLYSGRSGKRPMILSRYAGPASHRYPASFSGDTIISWKSLDFQPYFTLTASNIGFGWWSHDIGGHMLGEKDDELAGRWLQLGVFSPICRLHSSNSLFSGKEPWNYRKDICEMMKNYLRLRHKMIPYLYTLSYIAYKEGVPMIQPMYYKNPESEQAYTVNNQYYLGENMIIAPITQKCDISVHKASVTAWVPDGTWYDFFNTTRYKGNRYLVLYRSIEQMPVLIKSGSIIPLTDDICNNDASQNPKNLKLRIFTGDDGEFTLYEDDNETCNYQNNICATTKYIWKEKKQNIGKLLIHPAEGNIELLPEKRNYKIEINGSKIGFVSVIRNQIAEKAVITKIYNYEIENGCVVKIDNVCPSDAIEVEVQLLDRDEQKLFLCKLLQLLNQTECSFQIKENIYSSALKYGKSTDFIKEIQAFNLNKALLGSIVELL